MPSGAQTHPFRVVPLSLADAKQDFVCAREPDMAEFLREEALRLANIRFVRTYVIRRPDGPDWSHLPPLLGYHSIAMARVQLTELPEDAKPQVPTQALPAGLLAQLARDDRVPKDVPVAAILMEDVLRRFRTLADQVGCFAVTLDARREKLVDYYEREYGFRRVKRTGLPQKMFLLMSVVEKTLDALDSGTAAAAETAAQPSIGASDT